MWKNSSLGYDSRGRSFEDRDRRRSMPICRWRSESLALPADTRLLWSSILALSLSLFLWLVTFTHKPATHTSRWRRHKHKSAEYPTVSSEFGACVVQSTFFTGASALQCAFRTVEHFHHSESMMSRCGRGLTEIWVRLFPHRGCTLCPEKWEKQTKFLIGRSQHTRNFCQRDATRERRATCAARVRLTMCAKYRRCHDDTRVTTLL